MAGRIQQQPSQQPQGSSAHSFVVKSCLSIAMSIESVPKPTSHATGQLTWEQGEPLQQQQKQQAQNQKEKGNDVQGTQNVQHPWPESTQQQLQQYQQQPQIQPLLPNPAVHGFNQLQPFLPQNQAHPIGNPGHAMPFQFNIQQQIDKQFRYSEQAALQFYQQQQHQQWHQSRPFHNAPPAAFDFNQQMQQNHQFLSSQAAAFAYNQQHQAKVFGSPTLAIEGNYQLHDRNGQQPSSLDSMQQQQGHMQPNLHEVCPAANPPPDPLSLASRASNWVTSYGERVLTQQSPAFPGPTGAAAPATQQEDPANSAAEGSESRLEPEQEQQEQQDKEQHHKRKSLNRQPTLLIASPHAHPELKYMIKHNMCRQCGVKTISVSISVQHFNGVKHRRVVETANPGCPPLPMAVVRDGVVYCGDVHEMQLARVAAIDEAKFLADLSPSSPAFANPAARLLLKQRHCRLCGIYFNAATEIPTHLRSVRHTENLGKCRQAPEKSPPPPLLPLPPPPPPIGSVSIGDANFARKQPPRAAEQSETSTTLPAKALPSSQPSSSQSSSFASGIKCSCCCVPMLTLLEAKRHYESAEHLQAATAANAAESQSDASSTNGEQQQPQPQQKQQRYRSKPRPPRHIREALKWQQGPPSHGGSHPDKAPAAAVFPEDYLGPPARRRREEPPPFSGGHDALSPPGRGQGVPPAAWENGGSTVGWAPQPPPPPQQRRVFPSLSQRPGHPLSRGSNKYSF